MSKIIPVLPAKNLEEQCEFYEAIGFETVERFKAPPYAVVTCGDITFHFWSNKAQIPEENATCVFVEVENVDEFNERFTRNLKAATGRVPRSGFPRISKVRDLAADRRFTLADPSGNTLYFATPAELPAARTLESEKYRKTFEVAYDLLHSHENPEKAAKTLPKLCAIRDELNDADRAKVDILISQINQNRKDDEP